MLKVDLPDTPLNVFDQPDETARWLETLILEAEREIRGLERGPDRLSAVAEVVEQTVVLPNIEDADIQRRVMARMLVQVAYSMIVKGLPANLRSSKK